MEEITFEKLPQAVNQLYQKLNNIEQLLLEKNNPQPEADQLLTIQEVGQLLNLSVPTLYGLTQRAEIPVSKKGKRLYFSKKEILDWVKSGRKKTVSETAQEAEAYLLNKKKGLPHGK